LVKNEKLVMSSSTCAPETDAARTEADADLANALAHPLNGLLALAELMLQQPLPAAAKAQAGAVLEHGQRMARLLCDARPPNLFANAAPVALRDVIDDLEATLRTEMPDGRLIVTCAAPADLWVIVDAAALGGVLRATMSEALALSGWGVVELQVAAALELGGRAVISGRLQAPGCDDADGSLRRRCARILDAAGVSAAPRTDRGAGFDLPFRFSAAVAAEALYDDGEAGEDEAVLPPRTHILIVDDNATNRIVAAALCEMFGCSSETVEDGLEAVQTVGQRAFDLILMDIKMPHMDGIEATRAIRAMPGPTSTIPIVALTANADPDAVQAYLASGMQGVVDKPIRPEQLLNTLQRVLSERDETAQGKAGEGGATVVAA